uniref:Uncharacterized protein n=1 Tax=Oryza nivara TaxID=4536 RepID=A0A0E0HKR5_ORYNI
MPMNPSLSVFHATMLGIMMTKTMQNPNANPNRALKYVSKSKFSLCFLLWYKQLLDSGGPHRPALPKYVLSAKVSSPFPNGIAPERSL